MNRRELLGGAAALALGCRRRPDPPSAERWLAASGEERDALVARWCAEAGAPATARALALAALARCPSEAVDPSGTASHALLGLAGAARLAARAPELGPVAVRQAAAFTSGEVDASPYFAGAWFLPAAGPDPGGALDTCVARGDVGAADAWAAARGRGALPALAALAFDGLGHLGHRALFVQAAAELGVDALVRAAARHLASTPLGREPPGGGPLATELAAAGHGGAWLLDRAVGLLHHAARADAATAHVVTFTAAAVAVADHLPEPAAGLSRAADWLDRVALGDSELGPWRDDRAVAPVAGDLAGLAAAVDAADEDAAAARAAGLDDPRGWAWLAARAVAVGEVTLQHAPKLAAVVPDSPEGRAVLARLVAWATVPGSR